MSSLSLSRLPSRVQLVLFVLLSLGGAFAYYFFIDAAARHRIAERTRELATARARLEKGVLVARRLPEVQQEVADLQASLDSLGRMLPEETDAADLLRTVHTLAAQSNVTILGFRPQATITRQQHAEWPIGLELEGTYHNFGAFLDRVSKYPRIINVAEVVIRGKQQAHPDLTVDITCTVATFVLPGSTASAAVTGEQPRSVLLPAPWANFIYSADGRRDPFVRLVNPSTDTGTQEPERPRPNGVAGLTVDEVVVRGVVQSRGVWIAVVSAPSGRTHFIRAGDILMDGSVESITGEAVVLVQVVSNPLSREKQREVRKPLRGEVQ